MIFISLDEHSVNENSDTKNLSKICISLLNARKSPPRYINLPNPVILYLTLNNGHFSLLNGICL